MEGMTPVYTVLGRKKGSVGVGVGGYLSGEAIFLMIAKSASLS